jgi:hypothetical protein
MQRDKCHGEPNLYQGENNVSGEKMMNMGNWLMSEGLKK